jgi:hypothetical protein
MTGEMAQRSNDQGRASETVDNPPAKPAPVISREVELGRLRAMIDRADIRLITMCGARRAWVWVPRHRNSLLVLVHEASGISPAMAEGVDVALARSTGGTR